MTAAREVRYLVVHCSATPPKMDIGRKEIDQWHKTRGWSGIGYHFCIRRNGIQELGRKLNEDHLLETLEIGAHVEGYNSQSIGICLVGGVDEMGRAQENFTKSQYDTLETLLNALADQFPGAEVKGHRDFPGVSKACPSFDVGEWWIKRNRASRGLL